MNHRKHLAQAWLGGAAFAALGAGIGLAAGPAPADLPTLLQQAWGPSGPTQHTASAILWDVRLPRVLGSQLVGACLSLAGVLLQSATRNPIADPYLVGTSAGATLAAVVVTPWVLSLSAALGLQPDGMLLWAQPVAALFGAIGAISLALTLARHPGPHRPERILLAGLVLSAFAGAATSFFLYQLNDIRLRAATQWLMGGVAVPSLWVVLPAGICLVGALGFAASRGAELNALGLGPEAARGLGVDSERLGRRAVLWSSALTAVAVSLAGIIGFIGLLVPHALRRWLGRDMRVLAPASLLFGGGFLCILDALARILVTPAELPVGILTALAGAPVLFALLRPERSSCPQHQAVAPDLLATFPRPTSANQQSQMALRTEELRVHAADGTQLLAPVTLALPAGQLVAVLGPNGAGKTTLLRALAGTASHCLGTIDDFGQRRHGAANAQRLAYLPQGVAMEAGWRVQDVVTLGRTAWLTPHERWTARLDQPGTDIVDQAMVRMNIAEFADRTLDQLSGGQRQRVMVAMALAQSPQVLLLDEPTASLDLPQADQLLGLCKQLAAQSGLLVVVAMHDLGLALRHVDRVLVLQGGALLADGSADDVQEALNQAFSADIGALQPRWNPWPSPSSLPPGP